MEREHCLEVVRSLTRQVVAAALPGKLPAFEEDFAVFALTAGAPQVSEKIEAWSARDRGLDTTLVAGMFFQVLVEAEKLPATVPERISFVRHQAKNFLATRLAGQITLSQFYRLLNLIEEKVQHYFEYLQGDWLGRRPEPAPEAAPPPPETEPAKAAELRRALLQMDLPQKGRRITSEGLASFLLGTKGRWFRLLDLEAHFQVNKKTAWSYLNRMLKAGLLEHNGEKANRVRYALAAPFRSGGQIASSAK